MKSNLELHRAMAPIDQGERPVDAQISLPPMDDQNASAVDADGLDPSKDTHEIDDEGQQEVAVLLSALDINVLDWAAVADKADATRHQNVRLDPDRMKRGLQELQSRTPMFSKMRIASHLIEEKTERQTAASFSELSSQRKSA